VFDNAQIKSTIEREILPIFDDSQVKKVLLVSYLLKQSGHEADPPFLREVTGLDPYEALSPVRAAASELFDLSEQLELKSAVFSSYLVNMFFNPVR
jgi:hypothetical protein